MIGKIRKEVVNQFQEHSNVEELIIAMEMTQAYWSTDLVQTGLLSVIFVEEWI